MTFYEIVTRVMARLNISSTTSESRISDTVNDVYKAVTSAIGLETSRQETTTFTVNSTSATYATLPEIEFEDMEKVIHIDYLASATARPEPLEQITYNSLLEMKTENRRPYRFAVKSMNAHTVTIRLDGYPTGNTNFILRVTHLENAATLEAADEPAFPESFHDVLVNGAMAIEYAKMEKAGLSQMFQRQYELRLSDLRMYIAKAAYMDAVQAKDRRQGPYPWRRYGASYPY